MHSLHSPSVTPFWEGVQGCFLSFNIILQDLVVMNVTFPNAARIGNLESKIQGALKRKTLWMLWRQQQNQLTSNLQSAYAALQFIEGHEVFCVCFLAGHCLGFTAVQPVVCCLNIRSSQTQTVRFWSTVRILQYSQCSSELLMLLNLSTPRSLRRIASRTAEAKFRKHICCSHEDIGRIHCQASRRETELQR